MSAYHEAWAIVNKKTGQVVTVEYGLYWMFDSEQAAWASLVKNGKLFTSLKDNYTVRRIKISLPWAVSE